MDEKLQRIEYAFKENYSVNAYLFLNTKEVRMGIVETSLVLGFSKGWFSQVLSSRPETLQVLKSLGFSGEIKEGTVVNLRSGSKVKTISLSDFNVCAEYAAHYLRPGKREAINILSVIKGKTLRKERNSPCYLYLMADISNNVCKIGISNNPEKRLRSIQTGYPYPLTIISTKKDYSVTEEKKVHDKFSKYKLNGEWFQLAQEIEEFFNT